MSATSRWFNGTHHPFIHYFFLLLLLLRAYRYIELVAPTPTPTTPTTPAPPNILRTELEKWGAGMSMVALQCNGVAATVAMLKRNKVRVLDADPAHVMVHPSSTHGVLLQLVEKHRTRAQLDAAAADTPGHVRDTSGLEGRIVSFKCIILYVQSVEQAVQSYQKYVLHLLHTEMGNHAQKNYVYLLQTSPHAIAAPLHAHVGICF